MKRFLLTLTVLFSAIFSLVAKPVPTDFGEKVHIGVIGQNAPVLHQVDESTSVELHWVTQDNYLYDAIGSPVAPKKRKFWNDPIDIDGRRVYQRDDLFDINAVDDNGLTNLQRMKKGQAPMGYDGDPVNLHHVTQMEPGPIAEIGGVMHTDLTDVLHIKQYEKISGSYVPRKNYSFRKHNGRKSSWPRTKKGNIQRTQAEKDFINWSRRYWKSRAKKF